jgi:hypothetical protein
MAFVLRGDYKGVPATISWLEPGRIDSRPSALGMAALDLVREGAIIQDGPGGADVLADVLEPRAALVTLRSVFDRPEQVDVEGEVPGAAGADDAVPRPTA